MSNVNWNGILKNFPIRSWSNFFEKSSFQKPTSVEEMRKRFETNIQYFLANYLICGLIVFIYCILTSPLFSISLFVLCVLWITSIIFIPSEGLDLRKYGISIILGPTMLYVSLAIASGIILVISSQFLISFWLVFIAVHSTFRKRSIKGTISSFVDRLKGRDVQQGVGIVLEEMQQSLDDEFEHTEQQKQQESRKKSKQENK